MGINNPGGGDSVWTLLHDETLAALGRFDVSGITAAHDHLQIVLYCRTDIAATGDAVYIFFNGDSTVGNYRMGEHIANTLHSVAELDSPNIAAVVGASATANYFAIVQIFVPHYTNDKNKLAISTSGHRRDASQIFNVSYMVHWENTAAITQVTLQPDGYAADEFIADSQLQIWGIGGG